jgi:hypothetical protein
MRRGGRKWEAGAVGGGRAIRGAASGAVAGESPLMGNYARWLRPRTRARWRAVSRSVRYFTSTMRWLVERPPAFIRMK